MVEEEDSIAEQISDEEETLAEELTEDQKKPTIGEMAKRFLAVQKERTGVALRKAQMKAQAAGERGARAAKRGRIAFRRGKTGLKTTAAKTKRFGKSVERFTTTRVTGGRPGRLLGVRPMTQGTKQSVKLFGGNGNGFNFGLGINKKQKRGKPLRFF